MLELIKEQKNGPLYPMEWWRINEKYTVNISYEPSQCFISIVNSENESIVEEILSEKLLKEKPLLEKAPLGGILIKTDKSKVKLLLHELESILTI